MTKGKQDRTFVAILSPLVQIPTELEKVFVVIEHDLPGREQLEEIARGGMGVVLKGFDPKLNRVVAIKALA